MSKLQRQFLIVGRLLPVLALVALVISINPTGLIAQGESPIVIQPASGFTTLEGNLSIVHVDPEPGSDMAYYNYVMLMNMVDGVQQTTILDMPIGQAWSLQRQFVRVMGRPQVTPDGEIFTVDHIEAPYAPSANLFGFLEPITGNFEYINITCQFSNSGAAPTQGQAYFDGLMADTFPGISDHWRKVSNGKVSMAGSASVNQWYRLNSPASSFTGSSATQTQLANECIAAADADVDFSQYDGINIMVDQNYVGFAQGTPGFTTTIDGVTKAWRLTWNPPFSWQQQYFISHEVGHTIGIPHSGGDPSLSRFPYDSFWDTMSGGGENFKVPVADYTAVGPGTSSAYMERLGWIESSNVLVVNDGTSSTSYLERLLEPQCTGYPWVIRIPINGSEDQFYVVEAHDIDPNRNDYYDNAVPAEGVLIYKVDLTVFEQGQDAPARVVDPDANADVNDAGAVWLPGETFTDSTNNISVQVISGADNTYAVFVNNDGTGTAGTPTGSCNDTNPTPTPTSDPGATETPVPTATPQGAQTINRIAPTDGQVISTAANYVSKFQWEPLAGIEWYQIFVSTPDFGTIYLNEWYQASQVCSGSVCTAPLDIWFAGSGNYDWWMSYYGPNDTDYLSYYHKTSFSISIPAPGSAAGTAPTGTVDGNGLDLQWEAGSNAIWYQVWIGTADYTATAFLNWINGTSCIGGTCSLSLNGTLPAGNYEFWIQSWNPAGITNWEQATTFSVQ